MHILLFFLFLAGLLAVLLFNARRKAETEETWSNAASELKLHFSPAALLGAPSISGSFDGMHVHAETFTRSSGDSSETWTRLTVNGMGRIPPQVTLKAEGSWAPLRKVFTGEDVQIDDKRFDE